MKLHGFSAGQCKQHAALLTTSNFILREKNCFIIVLNNITLKEFFIIIMKIVNIRIG